MSGFLGIEESPGRYLFLSSSIMLNASERDISPDSVRLPNSFKFKNRRQPIVVVIKVSKGMDAGFM